MPVERHEYILYDILRFILILKHPAAELIDRDFIRLINTDECRIVSVDEFLEYGPIGRIHVVLGGWRHSYILYNPRSGEKFPGNGVSGEGRSYRLLAGFIVIDPLLDRSKYVSHIILHLDIGELQDTDAEGFDFFLPEAVFCLMRVVDLVANLDCQAEPRAVEIDDVFIEGFLPVKFVAPHFLAFELLPEQ